MNRLTQIILSIIVGLVSFVFFVILLFPLDAIISDKLASLEQETKGRGDYRVSVSNIDASLIFDTKFDNFRLFKGNEEIFYAPKIKAGLSLLPLISQTINVQFSANYKRGSVSGRVTLAEESIVDLDIEGVYLKELKFLTRYMEDTDYPVSLSGRVEGNIYFAWPQDLKNREADINIKIYNSKLNINLKKLEIDVPTMVLSGKKNFIEFDASLEKGTITLSKFSIPGPALKLELNGGAKLARNNSIVRINLDGSLEFSEKIEKDFPYLSLIANFKDEDGTFPLNMTGSLAKPRFKVGDLPINLADISKGKIPGLTQ